MSDQETPAAAADPPLPAASTSTPLAPATTSTVTPLVDPMLEDNIGPQNQLSASQLLEIQKLLLGGASVLPDSSSSPNTSLSLVDWESVQCGMGEKNLQMHCPRCPSKIALAGVSTLVSNNMSMAKYKIDAPDEEVVTTFWLLTDLMAFENIGVSKLVGSIKFLSCADCDVGPLGWHDLNDRTKFYVAAERVRYVADE